MLGYWTFLACSAISTAWSGLLVCAVWRDHGARTATGPALVLSGGTGAYMAVCIWLGYSFAAQLLGTLAACGVLILGRKALPYLLEYGAGQ